MGGHTVFHIFIEFFSMQVVVSVVVREKFRGKTALYKNRDGRV